MKRSRMLWVTLILTCVCCLLSANKQVLANEMTADVGIEFSGDEQTEDSAEAGKGETEKPGESPGYQKGTGKLPQTGEASRVKMLFYLGTLLTFIVGFLVVKRRKEGSCR